MVSRPAPELCAPDAPWPLESGMNGGAEAEADLTPFQD